MTREEVIRLAKEAGIDSQPGWPNTAFLERFAELVAAAERERCAKVIERLISGDGICADDGVWIHDCAEAIRAMGSE